MRTRAAEMRIIPSSSPAKSKETVMSSNPKARSAPSVTRWAAIRSSGNGAG